MASALAQQLAQLKGLHVQERWTKGKLSLLFDYQKAADVSAETILGIAQQGIESLCKADRRYVPFSDSLFSRASLAVVRDQLTKDENEQLNTNLMAFLRVLVNHFLLPAAFQVLEYCIRRYEVHVHNVSELLLCALPYHSTPEFARLVAVLQLKGGPWEWLTPCQQSGAPPPRELLVRRCVSDQAVIREVCKGAESVGVQGFISKTYLSFYAVLLCEVFTAAPRITEELLTVLLPYLVAGLMGSATRDYRAATLMVLTQLLSRAQLGREFLTAVVPEVVRSAPELGGSTAIMLLAHMAASQPELKALPAKSLQLLVEHCQAGQQVSDLQARGANLVPLLTLLLTSLAQVLPQHPQLQPLLLDLLDQPTLDTDLVQNTAVHLLQAGAAQLQQLRLQDASAVTDKSKQQHLQQALRVFDLHYPDQLDAAINEALQAARSTTATADDSSKKTASKHKKNKQKLDANLLFDFVQQCFSGSRHEVLAVAQQDGSLQHQHQQQALTLSLAVSAPASQMRLMALQKLDAICSQPGAADSTRQLLLSSLQSCLRDDSFVVAGAAAGAAGLSAVPAEEVLSGLQYLLGRAVDWLSAGHTAAVGANSSRKSSPESNRDVLTAARAALTAVAALGERAAAHHSDVQQVSAIQTQAAMLLLEYTLVDKRLKKLSKAAVGVCCDCSWHPLLQLLASAPAVSAALQQDAPEVDTAAVAANTSSSKRRKGSQAGAAAGDAGGDGKHASSVAVNRSLVQTLADGLTAAGGSVLLSEITTASGSCGPRCLHLLLLALVRAAADGDVAAAAVPPTPSGKGRGRGKQQQTRSSQPVDKGRAANRAQIAAALLQMLEQQITPAAARSGRFSRSSRANLLLPTDWQALAAATVDDMLLPTKHHYQQLHSQLPSLHAAVLLTGLKSALAAAPVEELSTLLGQPVQVFARLAQVSAASGQDSLAQHVQLLVLKSGQTKQQQLNFLAGMYGLPAGVCGAEVQVAALQALQAINSSQLDIAAERGSTWFLQLLAAVNSSHRDVRGAALDALFALQAADSGAAAAVGNLSADDMCDLVSALQQHQELLRGSAGALTSRLCSAMAASSLVVDATAGGGTRGRGRTRPKNSKAAAAAKPSDGDAADSTSEMQLPASCSQALLQLLLAALPLLHEEARLPAAELAVQVLAAACDADVGEVAVAAQQLSVQLLHTICQASAAPDANSQTGTPVWQQLAVMQGGADAATNAGSQLQQLRIATAVGLMQLITAEVFKASAAGSKGVVSNYIALLQLPFEAGAAVAAGLASEDRKLAATELAAVAPVRTAALQHLTADVFAALSPQQQQAVLTAALQTHSADGDAACRTAARSALDQLPVTAGMLLPSLQRVSVSSSKPLQEQQQQSRSKRTKRVSSQVTSSQQQDETMDGVAAHPLTASDIDAAVAALELLQWKEDIQDKQQLLQPLQDLLRVTMPLMGTITETYQEADSATAADADSVAPGAASPSAVGYVTQLALLTVEHLLKQYGTAAGAVDPALVLSCAAAAPDGATRNAALLLLAELAQLSPGAMLGHVLQALSVIQQSAALQDDIHSQAVASTVLSSLVPAWLAAGRSSGELWGSLLEALPGLPATRRLRMMESLLKALPQESGLPVGLLLMMQRVASNTTPATASAPGSSRRHKKGRKTPAAVEELPDAPDAAAASGADESAWLLDLMAALCEQVSVPARLKAFSVVLASSLAGPEGPLPAHSPLPRLAVSFITANLKVRFVVIAAHAAVAETPEEDSSNSPAAAIQQACQSIMAQALQHLLQLNPSVAAAQAAETPSKNSRRIHKAVRAAASGVYELLAALEAVQDCPSYLQALVEMCRHPAESVQRRALKLLAARLLKAQVDLAELELRVEGQLSAAKRQDKLQQLAQAGLAICQELSRLLQSQAALTRQLALIAADAGTRQFGALLPGPVLGCLPTVVAAAGNADAPTPVRVSALACIASAVTAVGPKLVPLLPQTAAVVLASAQAACEDLQGFDHQLLNKQQQDGGSSSDEEQDDDDDEAVAARSKGEDAALQLAAALTALEALVTSLGGFLSPYLKQILQLLLHQQVLKCTTAGAAAAAARLRAALPVKIPARLLLEPLVSQWDFAIAAGISRQGGADSAEAASAEPAAALLELVAAVCTSMEPTTAANYHETVLTLLLRALDMRHKWLAATAGHHEQRAAADDVDVDAAAAAAAVGQMDHVGIHVVESAAVRALSALVMKLSESKFKPMFLRLVEWAAAGSSSTAQGSQGPGRVAAFMAVACMLAHRLRAVFTPYFKYFTIMHMKLLAGEGLIAEGKRPHKKHKKVAQAAPGPDLGLMVSGWLARLRAVHAVQLLGLHEPAATAPAAVQEQQERFDRLLPLVVEQLAEGPPAEVAAVLSVEGADLALDLPGGPIAALGAAGKAAVDAGGSAMVHDCCDIIGTAAIGALIQMAVASGSDVVWKPLHHTVLMATRGGSTRAKLLALGCVSRLAELLREEYLMLLPEALPFISELIEDGEVAVEGAAQGLIAQLEGLSGEKLEQYLKA